MNSGTSKRDGGAVGASGTFPLIVLVSLGISGRSFDPQRFGLEDAQARNLPDPVLGDRFADDLDIKAHVLARHLVEVDDLEGPAAGDIRESAVIAPDARGLQRGTCLSPGNRGARGSRLGKLQLLCGMAAIAKILCLTRQPFRRGAVLFCFCRGTARLLFCRTPGFLIPLAFEEGDPVAIGLEPGDARRKRGDQFVAAPFKEGINPPDRL